MASAMWRNTVEKRHRLAEGSVEAHSLPLHKAQGRRRLVAAGAFRALALLALLALFAGGLRMAPRYPDVSVRGSQRSRQLIEAPLDVGVSRLAGGGLDVAPLQLASGSAAADMAAASMQAAAWQPGQDGVLSFELCGGFATQRVALISGVVLAAELNRTLVLPRLLREGGSTSDFGALYDTAAFVGGLRAHGVRVAPSAAQAVQAVQVRLEEQYDSMAALTGPLAAVQHLWLSCPAFQVPPDVVTKHEQLVLEALAALQPTPQLQQGIASIEKRLQGLSGSRKYNVLHLKAEADWAALCMQWEADGMDNCMNNTAAVGEQLDIHHVDPAVPLLLATAWPQAHLSLVELATRSLEALGYKVLRRDEVGKGIQALEALSPHEAALVDHQLARGCHQFVGNSASAFSALLILERWAAGRYATYYNGGNIPLEAFLPLYPMPWVFTYNDWSAGTEYDQMVKVAVTSGIERARMKPYCMFSGSTQSPMYQWFLSKGVNIIMHEPAWKEELIQEGRRYRKEYTKHYSHLYATDGALVGAFQRIDIPILRDFDQYNYVLFTDCDVYFRRRMKLIDWGSPLPTALGLGFENEEKFPYNDGVMLWNMPYMRRTNAAFVAWILSQTNGLYFFGYGPVDQGAFNQYYEKEIRGKPINKNYNTKIYHSFRRQARIVHLHGPKLNHYLEYFRNGTCGGFAGLCAQGYGGGLCQYVEEYAQLAPDWPVAAQLHALCGNLRHGVWRFPWGGG